MTSTDSTRHVLTVSMTERMAQMLPSNSMQSFIAEQPDRFIAIEDASDDTDPHHRAFVGGTMSWFDSLSDALLFLRMEHAVGYRAMLLIDEGAMEFTVLSARNFSTSFTHLMDH